jgi:predicted SpoU family rRNA methylase
MTYARVRDRSRNLLLVGADRLDREVFDPADKAVPVGRDEFCYDIEVDCVVSLD